MIGFRQQIGAAGRAGHCDVFLSEQEPAGQGLGITAQCHDRELVACAARRRVTDCEWPCEGLVNQQLNLRFVRRCSRANASVASAFARATESASGKIANARSSKGTKVLLLHMSRRHREKHQNIDQQLGAAQNARPIHRLEQNFDGTFDLSQQSYNAEPLRM